jgi:hypothetical protein
MLPSAVRGTRLPTSTSSTYLHVAGITCMTPQAPAGDVTFGWFPDSIQASARTMLGRTP